MILDQRQSLAFRKTINGFIPNGVSSKMVFQCLPLPDSLSSIRKINIEVEKQIVSEKRKIGTLRINGRQMSSSPTHRKKIKSTNTKNRIKNINVVMDSPEKFVNTLVNLNERQSCQSKVSDYEHRIQIKTPKQIITSGNRSLAEDSRILAKYQNQINQLNNPEEQQFYEQMILDNPLLFKKIMMAYNASKRQAEKAQTKINIRKVINRKQQVKSLCRPPSLRLNHQSQADQKKFISILQYRQFQMGINLSNKLIVVPANEILYKAYICKGNNGTLVKSILKTRPWWSIRNRGQIDSCNLVWTEWKRTRTTNNLPSGSAQFNEIQLPSCELQIKSKMRQMRLIAQKKKDQVKKIIKASDQLWKYHEKTAGTQSYFSFGKKLAEGKLEQVNASLSQNKKYRVKKIDKQQKIVNHVPGCLSLHSKKFLFHNLKHYYQKQGKDLFSVIPLTFHITKGADDPEFLKFAEYFQQNAKKYKSKKGHNIWICKPGQNSNRGNGISVSNNLSEIRALANQKCSSHRSLIIQKYFENPFLYNKRKFDIRCYVLITTVNGIVKGYWYEDGYIRTASKQFSLKNLENKYIHLTNDAIQKKSQQYGKFENCNKISYSDFEKYLETNHPAEQIKFGDVVERMKQISTDLIHSVATQLNPHRKQYCFQLFGLDFMLDNKLNPYLIEANSNPCITVDGNVLGKIIPTMLQNMMRVAIDPIFPPPINESKIKYPYSNHFESNKMVLVYDSYYDQSKLESGPSILINEGQGDQQEIENQEQIQQ